MFPLMKLKNSGFFLRAYSTDDSHRIKDCYKGSEGLIHGYHELLRRLCCIPFCWHSARKSRLPVTIILLSFLGQKEKNIPNIKQDKLKSRIPVPNVNFKELSTRLKDGTNLYAKKDTGKLRVSIFCLVDKTAYLRDIMQPFMKQDWYSTVTSYLSRVTHTAEGNRASVLINWQFWASHPKGYHNDKKRNMFLSLCGLP